MKKFVTSIRTPLFFTLFFLIISGRCQVLAHSLWVNINDSLTHPPGHVMISLGWGHTIPLDDFLISGAGTVPIEKYNLVAPDNSKTAMALPETKQKQGVSSKTGMMIVPGDLGLRKISLTDNTLEGTYQVIAESRASYFTGYIDSKGKHHMTAKPMDEIKDAKSFDFSTRYKAVAKSYFAVKKWTPPAPAGHDLEILPETDLSSVKKGDLVKFGITLKGRPVTCDMHGMNYMTASSNAFGGPDNFMLAAYIREGKAQIRIPASGEWVCLVMVEKKVAKDNQLKDIAGKCQSIYYMSTISFTAKP